MVDNHLNCLSHVYTKQKGCMKFLPTDFTATHAKKKRINQLKHGRCGKAADVRADKKWLRVPEETTNCLQESQFYHHHQLHGGRFNGSEVPSLPEMPLEDTHKPQHGAQRERRSRLKQRQRMFCTKHSAFWFDKKRRSVTDASTSHRQC